PDRDPDPGAELQASIERGQAIFSSKGCVTCHAADGSGGLGPNLRTSSFNTFAALRQQIHDNMPQDNPPACVDGAAEECATDTANYILHEFQGQSEVTEPDIEY
ncbi:MAG: c-type cytochrome, partial [Pseudohongiellaceae bacterium]